MLPESYFYKEFDNTPNYTTDRDHTNFTGEEFMVMFLEELKNQDPMEPQDANKILEQTSQLANLEAIKSQQATFEEMNKKLEILSTNEFVHYIGKEVELDNNDSFTYTGEMSRKLINSEVDLSFITAEIFDTEGNKIKTILKENISSGTSQIYWNGTNDISEPMPYGNYIWKIKGYDSSGDTVDINKSSFVVNSIINENGKKYLSLDPNGEIRILPEDIKVLK